MCVECVDQICKHCNTQFILGQWICFKCLHDLEVKPKYIEPEPDPKRLKKKEREKITKYKVFMHYSDGKMECECCKAKMGLTIDHIDGGGYIDRKKGRIGKRLYTWLKNNNFPEGFQVLCWLCNSLKNTAKQCPCEGKGYNDFIAKKYLNNENSYQY